MAYEQSSEVPSDLLPLLERCEERLGYQFQNKWLLHVALTHASGADHRLASNERLEFLGDSILGVVVCETLFQMFPSYLEGDLTKIKSVVVSRITCAKISRSLNLEEFLLLGKGMASAASLPPSVLSDVFEALVAAIHLDGGPQASKDFILKFILDEITEASTGQTSDNYKSMLQQLAQREYGTTPTYHLVDEKGPDHSKCFQVSAQVSDNRYEPAWGKNKKEAEQRAAGNALSQLSDKEIPFPAEKLGDDYSENPSPQE